MMRNPASTCLIATVVCAVGFSFVGAQTVYVDPDSADGIAVFASLNAATVHLTSNGQPGETKRILVLTNRLEIAADVGEGGVRWSGDEELIIDGDGDGDGVWCTLVCGENVQFNGTPNTENVVFRIQRSAAQGWDARVVIRNFVMIPEWLGPGAVTQVARGPFSAALGAHPETAGEILLENIVITASLPDDTPANPFQPLPAEATRWFRGLHTGSKASTSTQARTRFDFRNVVINGTSLSAVTWFGDHSDVQFGPGFVVTNSGSNPVINIVNSAYHNRFTIIGTPQNRNLFWNNGLGMSSSVIQLLDGVTSGSSIDRFAHTDLLSNNQTVLMDVYGSLGPVSHAIVATPSNATVLRVSGSTNSPIVVESTSSIGTTGDDVSHRIEADGTRMILLHESFSIDAVVEVQALESDVLAWRHSPPPTATASLFQIVDSSGDAPEVISSDLVDYPMPTDIDSWRAKRISLEHSPFLRPVNESDPQGSHAGERSFAPLAGGIVGLASVSETAGLSSVGPAFESGEAPGAAALRPQAQTLWARREGADRPHRPFAGATWRHLATGEPLTYAHPLEAFIIQPSPDTPPIWLSGVLRAETSASLPASPDGVQSTLPWPGRLSDTIALGANADTLFFIFEHGTWRGAFFDTTATEWIPLTEQDAPGLATFAPVLRGFSKSDEGNVLLSPITSP